MDDSEISVLKRCRELLDSISPSGMWNGDDINEAGRLLERRIEFDKRQMNEFAERLLDLLSSFQFPYHDARVGAQIEIHLRTMAVAAHTLQDSMEEFKLTKDKRDQLYKSVTKFRDFIEKQDGAKNPNVTFKLSEIRNAIELIKDDHSVVADFAKRFINLCKGAQALWAHDYAGALQAFLIAFEFELPVGNWYNAWIEIRARHFVFGQLRACPEYEEDNTVVIVRFLRDKLKEAVRSGSTSAAVKQFTRFGNIVASSTGTASIDLPESLPIGILDTIQNVVQVSRKGNIGDDCLDIIEFILTSKTSTKMLRAKALELMYVIRDHPGTSVDVLKKTDQITIKFDKFIAERIESESEKEKNAKLKIHVAEKMEEDKKLRRLMKLDNNDKKKKPDPLLEQIAQVNQKLNAVLEERSQGASASRRSKLMKNLFKNLSKKAKGSDDSAPETGDKGEKEPKTEKTEKTDKASGTQPQQPKSFDGKMLAKIKPQIAHMDCKHQFVMKAIPIETWQHGLLICEECKVETKLDIWMAAKLGDIAGLTHFLDAGADVNAVSDNGATLLSNVIVYCPEPIPVIKLLVEHAAKIDTTHTMTPADFLTPEELAEHSPSEPAVLEGVTLLMLTSISHKNVDVINLLLNYGADISAIDNHGQTALFYFIRFTPNPLRSIQFLVNRDIPLDTQTVNQLGRNALIMAARYSNDQYSIIRYLVNAGADTQLTDSTGWNVLHYICQFLRSMTALAFCINHCRLDINAPNVDEGTRCLDMVLTQCANPMEPIKLILKHGYDIKNYDIGGRNCIHKAANDCEDTLTVIKYLVEQGADPKKIADNGWTTLMALAENAKSKNIVETAKYLIEQGVDVNISQEDGFTALTYASWFLQEPLSFIQTLVEAGAKPKKASNGDTALHQVVDNTVTTVTVTPAVQMLLDAGWVTSARGFVNRTPLISAACSTITFDTIPKFQTLLDSGADIKAVADDDRNVIVSLLCSEPHDKFTEPLKFLLENGASVNGPTADKQTAVHFAAVNATNPIEILTILKDAGANFFPEDSPTTPLHQLVRNDQIDLPATIPELLKLAPIDVNALEAGWTAFHLVANNHHNPLPVFKALVEAGANPMLVGMDDQTNLLHRLIINHNAEDYVEAVKWLLEKGIPHSGVDNDGWTPMMRAAQYANDPTVIFQLLLDAGADIAAVSNDRATVLHYIWWNDNCGDHTPHARFLIEKGASINATEVNKWTPMHYNARNTTNPVPGFELLLDMGADINAISATGETMLHLLAWNKYCIDLSAPAKLLLDKGISIEAKTDNGWTALHALAYNDDDPIDSIRVLLEKGADAKAVTMDNATCLHLLLNNYTTGVLETIPGLIEAGCPVDTKDSNEFTPLLDAAQVHPDPIPIMKLLKEHGADLDAVDSTGHGIHHKLCYNDACKENVIEILEQLEETLGVAFKPNIGDKDHTTPTHCVCCNATDTTLIEWVIERGGDINLTWKNRVPSETDYNGDRDGLCDSVLENHTVITDYLLERHLGNPRLAITALEWKKAKTTEEADLQAIDETMAKLVAALEEWEPKSDQEKEAADAAASATGTEVKEEESKGEQEEVKEEENKEVTEEVKEETKEETIEVKEEVKKEVVKEEETMTTEETIKALAITSETIVVTSEPSSIEVSAA
ncbi:ankyrin repeat-containing domain protein [Endogone sp. FLAS-F59071]|nr:ankyrin repeat-containing domain protein [Endogone sp. FLAS-F59071]|eukprot:RUS20359.1 ankyrin repeat-containing domain protein [Endogone sp. FLAS-F59071]